jgi:SpoU rRNA methylase family enzyme
MSLNGDSAVHSEAERVLLVAHRVDSNARISGVVRMDEGLVVKLTPSTDAGTATALGILTSVRLSFPYSTSTMVEDALTGATEVQVMLHAAAEEFEIARFHASQLRVVRVLDSLAKASLVSAVTSYVTLLYSSI